MMDREQQSSTSSRATAERIISVVGLFFGIFGVVPIIFSVKTTTAVVLAVLICLALVAVFLRGVHLWAEGRLDWVFAVLVTITMAMILIPLFQTNAESYSTTAPGTVGAPASDERPTHSAGNGPTITQRSAPNVTFLDGFEAVEGYLESGQRKVNGTIHEHALARKISGMCNTVEVAKAGFDLDRKFNSFSAVVGVSDDATRSATAQFKVLGDGELLTSGSATVGKLETLNASVVGILRLELVASTNTCGSGEGEVVWGNPTVGQ
jgi:hypothetical protein